MNPLPVDCGRPAVDVAPELIGLVLVHALGGRRCAGRIVECEAYGGVGDDACSHAFRGRTARNSTMFGAPGRLYVYFTYGMHHCANLVTHEPGRAGAVLLRAIEPVDGLDLMRRRRRTADDRLLGSGPARLVVAMGLGRRDDGRRVGTSRLYLVDDGTRPDVVTGTRIGVKGEDAARPWRFAAAGSPWVTRLI